ncbi:uncharacterized protein A4U43_C03F8300 [Asparagus officinalis]|uniref:Uncharacterized protein n=1 Tax=Asparagus officinalis TaxID=4686 RepID=A0A5P1F925_ASPOF|nr:uncharacterized protein A4U43_C03F8300 [Asparagus officinalis]
MRSAKCLCQDSAPREAMGSQALVSDAPVGSIRPALTAQGVGPRHTREPSLEHCHQPARHLNMRGSVLGSRVAQLRAVEQFWLPRDAEILGEVSNVNLHQALQSYLVRGALVEQELFDRIENI